jgi:hypothetical protein
MSEDERRDQDRTDREKGVRFFVPPQLHEGRVGSQEGVDAHRLMTIQKVIEQRAETFLDWTKETLARIEQELDSAARRKASDRRVPFNRINLIAHELRGQGTTFGYPLISTVAKAMFESTVHNFDRSDDTIAAIRAQASALHRILEEDLKGDGGETGHALLDAIGLRRADVHRTPAAASETPTG